MSLTCLRHPAGEGVRMEAQASQFPGKEQRAGEASTGSVETSPRGSHAEPPCVVLVPAQAVTAPGSKCPVLSPRAEGPLFGERDDHVQRGRVVARALHHLPVRQRKGALRPDQVPASAVPARGHPRGRVLPGLLGLRYKHSAQSIACHSALSSPVYLHLL